MASIQKRSSAATLWDEVAEEAAAEALTDGAETLVDDSGATDDAEILADDAGMLVEDAEAVTEDSGTLATEERLGVTAAFASVKRREHERMNESSEPNLDAGTVIVLCRVSYWGAAIGPFRETFSSLYEKKDSAYLIAALSAKKLPHALAVSPSGC